MEREKVSGDVAAPAGGHRPAVERDPARAWQRFLESVAPALADADAGRTMDTATLKARLAARRASR